MSETKRPLKVFLCHAHDDLVAVRAFYKRLKKDGVDAWLDKEKLRAGVNWEYEIRKAVRESDVVIVCLSKQFAEGGFRQKEVEIALNEAALKPREEIFIIPVRLEECNVPQELSIWHWVDLFRRGGYLKLMKSLKARALQVQSAIVVLPKPDDVIPNLVEELKPEQTKNIFVTVDGNVQGNIIIGDENTIQAINYEEHYEHQALESKEPEPEPINLYNATVDTIAVKPKEKSRRLKAISIIAIIVGIFVCLGIASPFISQNISAQIQSSNVTITALSVASTSFSVARTSIVETQTVKAQLTTNAETLDAQSTPTQIRPTVTYTIDSASTAVAQTASVQAQLTANQKTQLPTNTLDPCDQGQFIADVTVPDGTIFSPGDHFTKTWRIKNVGTCSWNPNYSLVFASGNSMSDNIAFSLIGNVDPGEAVDISVDLIAPNTPGEYTGYWQLQNLSSTSFMSMYLKIKVQ